PGRRPPTRRRPSRAPRRWTGRCRRRARRGWAMSDTEKAARPGRPAAKAAGKGSPEARRLAAAGLEGLAGLRGPAEAGGAAGISLPRYYSAEARALAGLVEGCEPAPRGRRPGGAAEVRRLRQENGRLQRQCDRHQAVLRLQQRALGLGTTPARG